MADPEGDCSGIVVGIIIVILILLIIFATGKPERLLNMTGANPISAALANNKIAQSGTLIR